MTVKISLFLIILLSDMKAQHYEPVFDLYHQYENYRNTAFSQPRFSFAHFSRELESLKGKPGLEIDSSGASVEGRAIYKVRIGTGPVRVMMWSQMHGDEPTATMALFDFLNFLTANDNFNPVREKILSGISLLIIPVVNPDGMERYKRRNAVEIDINRDALRLESPEAALLMNSFLEFKPDVSFNLHDQMPRYTAGFTHRSAVISLLAPSFNYEKELSPNRVRAMQICAHINNVLSYFVPGHIARYTDEFEPRAFGDNFQKLGSATVLIESGGWKNDPDKMYIRRLNFLAYVSALLSLAENRTEKIPLTDYKKIPINQKFLFDTLLRGLTVTVNDSFFKADIGINYNELPANGNYGIKITSTIEDAGDLSVFYGYTDYNMEGFSAEAGKIYPAYFENIEQAKQIDFDSLFSKGYIYFMLKEKPEKAANFIPPAIFTPADFDKLERKNYLKIGNAANFIITRDKQVRFVIINGSLYDTRLRSGKIRSGLIIN